MRETKNIIITILHYNSISHHCTGKTEKGNTYTINPFIDNCVEGINSENYREMGKSLEGKTFLIEDPYFGRCGTLLPYKTDFRELKRSPF